MPVSLLCFAAVVSWCYYSCLLFLAAALGVDADVDVAAAVGVAAAVAAAAAGAAVADEDSSRQTPNPANLGVGPDVSGHDHTLVDGARSATATKGRFGRHRKNIKTTILLHQIAIFGLECDLNKMQDRLRSK